MVSRIFKPGDVELLASLFLAAYCNQNGFAPKRFTNEALVKIKSYGWPGNVRELKNFVERTAIMSDRNVLDAEALPPFDRHEIKIEQSGDGLLAPSTFQEFKESSEAAFIEKKLAENKWNVAKTARTLDMQRSNLYKKIEKYKIRQEEE